jgi:hypothetical protein
MVRQVGWRRILFPNSALKPLKQKLCGLIATAIIGLLIAEISYCKNKI